MATLSIIIPVYNAAAHIERCVNSILAQTFTDFEAIFVNDGSTDDAPDWIRKQSAKDARIVLVDKPNGGVSSARNMGISKAIGEWVTFLDSDDWLQPGYLQDLFSATQNESDVDFVVDGFQRVSDQGAVLYTEIFPAQLLKATDTAQIFNRLRLHDYGYCWAKMYRKSILDKRSDWFNVKLTLYEDTLFVFEYLLHCNKVQFCGNINYNYLENQQSLTTKKRSFSYSYEPYRALVDFTNKHFDNQVAVMNHRWAIYMNDAIISNYLSVKDKKQRIANLKQFNAEDWQLYRQYFKPFNIFFTLFKYLLVQQRFALADLIMNLYFMRNR